jgi:hypothetical protein
MSEDSRRTAEDDSPLEAEVDSEPIKVTDRRKFDRAGRRRDPAEEAGQAEEVEEPGPPATEAAGSGTGANSTDRHRQPSNPQPAPKGAPPDAAAEGQAERPQPEGSLFGFFVTNLYESALHTLGFSMRPDTPPQKPDLQGARYFVEVLQVIEEKTRGNLTPAEQRLLKEVLYDLRMKYVGLSRQGSA